MELYWNLVLNINLFGFFHEKVTSHVVVTNIYISNIIRIEIHANSGILKNIDRSYPL